MLPGSLRAHKGSGPWVKKITHVPIWERDAYVLRSHWNFWGTARNASHTELTPTDLAKTRTFFGALMDFLLFGELHTSAVILFQIQPWFCTLCTATCTTLKSWQHLSCISPKIRMSSLVVKSFGDMLNYFSDVIFTFFPELSIFWTLIFCAVLRQHDQKMLCQLRLWQKCQALLKK